MRRLRTAKTVYGDRSQKVFAWGVEKGCHRSKQVDSVGVLPRMIEVSVLSPVLDGGYMGIYESISTSLRFKRYPRNYFKCGVTVGPQDAFFSCITKFP